MAVVAAGSFGACQRTELSSLEQWPAARSSISRDRNVEPTRVGHVASLSSSTSGRSSATAVVDGKKSRRAALRDEVGRIKATMTWRDGSAATGISRNLKDDKIDGGSSVFFGRSRDVLLSDAGVSGRGGSRRRVRRGSSKAMSAVVSEADSDLSWKDGGAKDVASSRTTGATNLRESDHGDIEDLASRRSGECSTAGSTRLEWRTSRRALMGTVSAALIGASWMGRDPVQAATTAVGSKPALWMLGDVGSNGATGVSLEKLNSSRVYDATILGEPGAIGDKARVWKALSAGRVLYLGESERSPDPDDRMLELNIVAQLRELFSPLGEVGRPITLVLQLFHRPMQDHLNLYMDNKLSDDELRASVPHWPAGRWEQYLPLLHYARENSIRLVAGGVPDAVLRNVEAHGVRALSDHDRRKYVPPLGGGGVVVPGWERGTSLQEKLLPYKASLPRGPGPAKFAQARLLGDHTMAMSVVQSVSEAGPTGLVVAMMGASHVRFGAKGRGVPMRVAQKLKGISQIVVMLNPERQRSRVEGELPEADFLWYSGAKQCTHNCFDRAEVARVMGAAGTTREALPLDLQAGLDQGLVAPDVLQTFFDLDQHPLISMTARKFQGLRERWLADPRFLQRLAIEEVISVSTTLLAQYEKRRERFWDELEYVFTDVTRGALVDFFTVWLPAPTLSFRSLAAPSTDAAASGLSGLSTLLGSLPDNAFQRGRVGEHISLLQRVLAVVVGGAKLFGVGLVASMGTLSLTNGYMNLRQKLNPEVTARAVSKRSPVLKTGLVYALFLATSSNLRYQAIAGLVEHWGADYFLAKWPLAGSALSFTARIGNSYWATYQWVDLARFFQLQGGKKDDDDDTSSSSSSATRTPAATPTVLMMPSLAVHGASINDMPTLNPECEEPHHHLYHQSLQESSGQTGVAAIAVEVQVVDAVVPNGASSSASSPSSSTMESSSSPSSPSGGDNAVPSP